MRWRVRSTTAMSFSTSSPAPILPAFVTHEPDGAEAKYISALWKLAPHFPDELSSEQDWVDKGLVRARESRVPST